MRGRTWHRQAATALMALLISVVVVAWAPPAGARPEQASATVSASIDDATLTWGQSTTVRGSGWAPGKEVAVVLYPNAIVLTRTNASPSGSITAGITAPSRIASSSKYRVAVQGVGEDNLGGLAQVAVTIVGPTPTFSLSSSELHWRDTVTVSGQRYQPGTKVSITLFPDNAPLGSTTVGAGDRFDLPVQIPSGIRTAKDYEIAVSGTGIDGLFHFDHVQATIIGDRPLIQLNKARVPRGGDLEVSGQRFLTGTSATITLLPGYERLAVVDVGSDGTFAKVVGIPGKAYGKDPHQIVVTGQGADGILAYSTAPLTLGGVAPSGVSPNAPFDPSLLPPGFEPSPLGSAPVTLPGSDPLPSADGAGSYLINILLIILLVAATVVLMVLTSRRGFRAALRRRWDHVARRLHRGSS